RIFINVNVKRCTTDFLNGIATRLYAQMGVTKDIIKALNFRYRVAETEVKAVTIRGIRSHINLAVISRAIKKTNAPAHAVRREIRIHIGEIVERLILTVIDGNPNLLARPLPIIVLQ